MKFLRKLLMWFTFNLDDEPTWIDADYTVIEEGR